jgi:transposase-like protein
MKTEHRPVTRSVTTGVKPSLFEVPRAKRKVEGGLRRGKRSWEAKANAVKTFYLVGCKLEEAARQVGTHKHTLAQWIRELSKKLDLDNSEENYSACQDFN